MKKIIQYSIGAICVVVGLFSAVCRAQSDDFSRSIRDAERATRQFRQQQDQMNFRSDMKRIEKPTFETEDRAAKKNKELLDKMIADQNRDLGQEMDDWLEKFTKEYRLMIEVVLIALAISSLSIFFYRQKLKKIAKEKEKEIDQARRDRQYRK